MPLRAFHGAPELKAKYLNRVAQHRALDHLVQGIGWNGMTKGCAVGCTLEAYDHVRYPIELGVPLQLAYLEDQLFEQQNVEDAQRWPERFLSAIPVGADLTRVWPEWAVWMLVDPAHGVIKYACGNGRIAKAIEQVAAIYRADVIEPDAELAAEAAATVAAAGMTTAAGRAATVAARAAAAAATTAAAAQMATRMAAATATAAAQVATRMAAATSAARGGLIWTTAACDRLIALLMAAPVLPQGVRE